MDGLFQVHGKLIVELANKHRLPAIYQSTEFVFDGGLISYGVNYPDQYRRVAGYLDRIIKGAKPGDLPFEQLTHMEMVVNAKAAKALGIVFPQTVLLRAAGVIE